LKVIKKFKYTVNKLNLFTILQSLYSMNVYNKKLYAELTVLNFGINISVWTCYSNNYLQWKY